MTLLSKNRRYKVLEALGEGGTGAVYRALDRVRDREVAVKVLREASPAALAGREFQLLASHDHPNLVRVFDYGATDDGLPFFTMEYCGGVELLGFVSERLPSPPAVGEDARFRAIVLQVLAALDYIHTHDLVHHDLKPSNILVDEVDGEARVKLIDFGLAAPARVAAAEGISGTVEYLAPERIRGEAGDHRSDLYALGVILYEIFRGQPPFAGASAGGVVRGHLEGEVDAIDALPPPYAEVVARLLSKSPADRPASAEAVVQALFGADVERHRLLPAFSSVFVGREATLSRLISSTHEARLGRPRATLLSGATGMGKTRLLRELQIRLQLSGTAVHAQTCEAGDGPGALLVRLLARLAADAPENSPRSEALEALLAELRDGPPGTGAARESSTSDPGADLESVLYRASECILQAAAATPTALLVDDLQWADTPSLEAITYLQRRIEHADSCRVSLVLSCRNDDEHDDAFVRTLEESAGGMKSFDSVRLAPFDENDVSEYLVKLLGDRESFPDLPRSLVEDTGGNPFFMEEYLKLRAEFGGIERAGKGWRLNRSVQVPIPESLEEAAFKRLRRVKGLRREVLEWAAVLGQPFEAEELRQLLVSEREDGASAIADVEAALAANALDQMVRRSGTRYRLAHAALEDAAYRSIDEDVRKRRHRSIADWLLAAESPPQGARLERIAHHLYRSDTPAASRPFLLRAGDRARRAGALQEAVTHLSRALEFTTEPDERFQALLWREEVWGHLGRKDEQQADLRELQQIASSLGDASRRRAALRREALFLDSRGDKRQALQTLKAALDIAGAEGSERAQLVSRAAAQCLFLSEFEEAAAMLDEALSIARQTGDRDQEAECLQLVGLGNYLQGAYDKALAHMERALVIRADLGDDRRAGALESNLGLIQFDRGMLEAAEERFQNSLKTFRRIGLRRGEAVNLLNLGLVHSDTGRLERALDFINEALQIRRELGDRHGEGTDTGNLGAVWIRAGRFERAAPLLETALARAREAENHLSESINEARLGLIDMQRGDLDGAKGRLERAVEIAGKSGGASQKLIASTSLARHRMLAGDPEAAVRVLREALEIALAADMRSWVMECRSLLANALLDLGELKEADTLSAKAVEELERSSGWLERSQEIWFIRYRVLDALRQQGKSEESGETALRRAYTLLREKADSFEDPELRHGFLKNIALHRDIDRLHEELQRRIRREASRRERSFYDVARSIHSILDLDPLLDRLLELAIETTRAEKGLILLRDGDSSLTIRAARGMARESVEDAANICQSVISDVARGGEPVLATDASSDDRFRDRRSIISFQIRTLMCVPLQVRNENIGAVYVDGRSASSFSPDDLDYLVCFAHLAAIAVDNARLWSRLQAENRSLRREVENRSRFENLLGRSPRMEQLMHLMEKVARTNASVLISGETGTGKAVIARAIHYASERRSRPFVTVDCGALPENLLESELFGHKKGAFSGAIHDRIGLIEEAEGGTLFLDEVTNTSLDLQAKLLRVLQEAEIRRVGENQVRRVDVRILAATNVDIKSAIDNGTFREDLFYRLNVVPIEVPPLRERTEDIPLLTAHFLKRSAERLGKSIAGFTEEAMRMLERCRWRGNVRELENVVEKAVILADTDRVGAEFLRTLLPDFGVPAPEATTVAAGRPSPEELRVADEKITLEEFDGRWREAERRYLLELAERVSWNLSAAARLAGVRNRNTLISRLKKHGLRRPGPD